MAHIMEEESEYFSPYRADGKLYGFVCVVTGANQPVGRATAVELAGEASPPLTEPFSVHDLTTASIISSSRCSLRLRLHPDRTRVGTR